MACYCHFETPRFYHSAQLVARKSHKCDECRREIAPGEQYERVRAMWWEKPDTYKTCCRCLDLRDYIKAHIPCFCWSHGDMIHQAIEYAREWAYEAPGLLFGAYRRAVMIRRCKKFIKEAI